MIFTQKTINCRGKLVSMERPLVMGILNVTPDSFFDGRKYSSKEQILLLVEKMLREGATFIDVGGMSTRPGAEPVNVEKELRRVIPVIGEIKSKFPEALISVDTVRSKVALESVEAGACIVNDISAGRMDEGMYETVGSLEVPYVLMHMQGLPQTMQQNPFYKDAPLEVLDFFIRETGKLRQLGVKDVILDPGFGFGKTVEHNFQLLSKMHVFKMLGVPLMAGISRKSMICKVLKVNPEKALNGTTALHIIALQQGANLLRVHDVKEAMEVIQLWEQLAAEEEKEIISPSVP